MKKIHEYVYEVDDKDRIVSVDTQWLSFAKNNGAVYLTRNYILGQNLYSFIAGRKLGELYERLLRAARQTGKYMEIPFRCDGPSVRRYMELDIEPTANNYVKLTGRILKRKSRRRVPIFDLPYILNGQWQICCSVCRGLMREDGSWNEAEEVLANPYDEPPDGLPQLSYDVCPACTSIMKEAIKN